MIDWTTIIVTAISLFSVGGVGVFIFYRANKGSATADAIQKAAEAMREMLNNASGERTYFKTIIDDKNSEIQRYIGEASENRKQLGEQSYKIAELERKQAGISREIGLLKQSLSEVEGIACIKLNCKIRQPELGMYKHKKAE